MEVEYTREDFRLDNPDKMAPARGFPWSYLSDISHVAAKQLLLHPGMTKLRALECAISHIFQRNRWSPSQRASVMDYCLAEKWVLEALEPDVLNV